MNYISSIYIIALLAIVLTGAVFAPKGNYVNPFFSQPQSKNLQGLFVLCITLHHFFLWIRNSSNYDGSLDFMQNIGILFVGFFFFCSGYGLRVSFDEKQNYLHSFVSKRILNVLVPFFICNYVYMLTAQIKGIHFTSHELVCAFFGFILLNDQMWFAVEILILYLLFYVCFRFLSKEKHRYLVIGITLLLLITVSLLMGHSGYSEHIAGKWFHGEWWYNTTIFFYIGLVIGYFREKICIFLRKYYSPLLILSVCGMILSWFLQDYALVHAGYWTETATDMGYSDKVFTLFAQFPFVFCFLFFVLLLMQKIQFGNKFLGFLGKISLEIILINKVFILSLESLNTKIGYHLYYLLVLLCTIASAFCIYQIKLWVLSKKY